jgi:hypothetical protein
MPYVACCPLAGWLCLAPYVSTGFQMHMLHHALIQKAPILCRLYLSLYLAPSLSSTHPEDFVFNYPLGFIHSFMLHL